MVHPSTARLTLAGLILTVGAWHTTTHTNEEALTSMLGNTTGASMLVFTALKAIKKTASAQELENVKKEIRRAEKGALTYGIINLLTSLANPNNDAVLPADAMQDTAAFTSTYWLVRKIARQILDSSIGSALGQNFLVDAIPTEYQKLVKQVVMGSLTHLVYNWSKGFLAT